MEPLLPFVLYLAPILLILLEQPRLFMSAAAQTNKLTVGSSITPIGPTRYLTSSSGIFAFGFCNVDPSLHPTQLLLAIWFDFGASDCTNKTVVWFARDPASNQAVIATKQSVLSLDHSNRLSLVEGQTTLWSPGQHLGSTLVLLDSGSLQLLAVGVGGGGVSWQSFDYPTHTLLPGQNMTNTSRTYLLSKNTDTDFSPGRFTLIVQDDDNIVLYMRDPDHTSSPAGNTGDPYWDSGTWHSGKVPTIVFDNSGNLFYNDSMNGYKNLTTKRPSNSAESYYHYAALDPDGTIRVYAHQKNNTDSTAWDVVSVFPGDGCSRKTKYGIQAMCGPNAYCKVSSLKEQRLNCECPDGYVFVDEQHKYRGCWPNFVPHSCDGKDHSGEFTTVKMDNTAWSNQSAYNKYPTTALQQCNTSCLNNCFCVAVLIDGSSCMEVEKLTDGKQGSGTEMTALIKVAAISSSVAVQGPTSPRSIWLYIIIGILAISFVASITYSLWQCYASKKAARRRLSVGLRTFTHKELYRATNGFKELLGKGGFGEVWKGEVSSLHPPHVAVKKLIKLNEHNERDFENEVQSLGRIHHKNLVRMIGYCKEGVHRMLVFEYMQGGTLADFIFRLDRPCWSCLAEAAIGIAKGLEYLHEGCKSQIIHCDIKPENILFDDKHTPRITDFGIAKLLGDQKTQHTVTTIAGTRPYVAPEWFDGGGKVDNKVDVYSFGVVLLEMICCKRAAGQQLDNVQGHGTVPALRAWAERLIRSGRAELLMQGESEALVDMESVERFARVAIWCLQKDPSTRPTMRKVVQMLEGAVEINPLPDPPRPPSFSAILPTGSETNHSSSTANALQIE
ncbi:G-type lectin S-receptor-like serine/threonine-protein kinase LECRK4 [Phragmites australis]|uniref:G-type lectin S-receptor-like serine/threonine-protein kinase LECRK4 n=1 Tax=Phragmites australis TaxID=29695 RepID=UPI002D78A71E|nr:G-type lectin S-receptor-like serine/threonine-protein kinase LECRK4 [Phragmites australis]